MTSAEDSPGVSRNLATVVLLVQSMLLGGGLFAIGWLSPEWAPDTRSYAQFPLTEPVEAAKHIRTYGYPLFLAVGAVENYRYIPLMHFVVHVVAVISVYAALISWSYPPWMSAFIASGTLWSLTLMRCAKLLTPDCVAHSLGVIAVAMLMMLVVRRRATCWIGLGLAVLIGYQLRPAYLFLVPLIPLLGALLDWWRTPASGAGIRSSLAFSGRLAATTFIPLLLFASYRFVLVGHFGLVAFGGYNATGVVSQFLQVEHVEQLPESVQELARRGLERRAELYADRGWSDQPTMSYRLIEDRFDANTWQIFVPVAREMWPDDRLEVNRRLARLAKSTALLRSKQYGIWLFKAGVRGVYLLFAELILNLFVAILWPTLAVRYLVRVRRHAALLSQGGELPARADFVSVPLLIAVTYALCNVGFIIITTPPLGRFVDPAGVWFPAVLAALVCQVGHIRRT